MSENDSSKSTETKKHKKYTVLGQHLGGGPHGLGDPNDNTLRRVEKDVLIIERIRYLSRTQKCKDLAKDFGECSKNAGLLLTFKCREENAKLKECLKYWFENEEFREQCKDEYLRERSEYRRTGIPPRRLDRQSKTWIETPKPQEKPL